MSTHRRTLPLVAAILSYLGLAVACGGGGGGTPPSSSPTNLQYATSQVAYREGAAITPNVPTWQGGAPTSFGANPALPTGLLLNPLTGVISGTPAAEGAASQHVITALNADGQTTDTVTIGVHANVFEMLADGFNAETVYENGAMTPVKHGKVVVAPAGDDRVFFTEVDTGNVRVIDPVSGIEAVPFATVADVRTGGHNGLLGLCLAPDFATSMTPYLYVLSCVNGIGMESDRMQVLRYTAVGNVGTNETVVIDDLPVSPPVGINNGGEICFDLSGFLFVSIGDVSFEANSDADASVSLAGKVLRYDVSVVPAVAAAGNPNADAEWCRGLRNTFGLAVHPTAGGLFGLDNGPAADDEMNFLQADKHFGWGGNPTGGFVGFRAKHWPDVIVPTGLTWHDGTSWGAAYANNLFISSYADHKLRRFAMSGSDFTEIDNEYEFGRLEIASTANHPLAVCVAPDGSLYLATFTGIYRITQM